MPNAKSKRSQLPPADRSAVKPIPQSHVVPLPDTSKLGNKTDEKKADSTPDSESITRQVWARAYADLKKDEQMKGVFKTYEEFFESKVRPKKSSDAGAQSTVPKDGGTCFCA